MSRRTDPLIDDLIAKGEENREALKEFDVDREPWSMVAQLEETTELLERLKKEYYNY